MIEANLREKDSKRNLILGISISLVAILFFASVIGVAKHSSNVEEEKLQTIVNEAMTDIKNGDFGDAYIKAESIRYTSDWSSKIEEKWNKTREALLTQIKEAERETKGKNRH